MKKELFYSSTLDNLHFAIIRLRGNLTSIKRLHWALLFAILFANTASIGQITFNKTIFTSSKVLQQTADHGYIVAGDSSGCIVLTKLNSAGVAMWGKIFIDDTPQHYSFMPTSVQQTRDKGYIIGGSLYSGITVIDMFLIKTDSNGVMQWYHIWEKALGSSPYDAYGRSVQQTADGGYILGGYWSGVVGSTWTGNMCLIKTDSLGIMTWTKSYSGALCYAVQQTADRGFIMTGYRDNMGSMNYDVALIKTDSAGNLQWSNSYGGAARDKGYGVVQTADAGYAIACYTDSLGATPYDAYLIKTDAGGNLSWSKTYNGLGTDAAYAIRQTNDGGYILGCGTQNPGGTDGGAFLIKTDGSGTMLWSKKYGSQAIGSSVQQTMDGGYIVNSDISVVIKTDSAGNACNQMTLAVNTATPVTIVSGFTCTVSSDFSPEIPQLPRFGASARDSNLCPPTTASLPAMNVQKDEMVTIFPNPSNGNFIVNYHFADNNSTLQILDIMGRLMYTERIMENEGKKEVNLSNLANGIYYFRVISERGKAAMGKVVIEK